MLMDSSFSESNLSRLSGLLEQWMGLHFPKERWSDLRRGVESARAELGFPDTASCVRRLISAPVTEREVGILASHLTVGETYFLRDGNVFEALEARIFPELKRSRDTARRLRIWSAGCCTGEEPYSLAMVLDRSIPERESWNITLLATDINPGFIRKAREGVYREWSFRDSPAWIRDAYFTKRRDGSYEVQPRIRRSIMFSHLNLAGDAYPSLATNTNAMDVILCRNVLMYFTAERARRVAERLSQSLVEGGWLIVSPTELSAARVPSLVPVEFPGMIVFRKCSAALSQETMTKNLAPDLALPGEFGLARRAHRSARGATPRPESQSKARPKTGPSATPPSVRLGSAASAPSEAKEADQAAAAYRLARARANEGKLAEALEWCERAIAADTLNPARYYLHAGILQELGQGERAVEALKRALYLEPEFALAHFALANLRLSLGRRRDAVRHFENAAALLRVRPRDEPVPESEGLTAGSLSDIVESLLLSLPGATAPRA